MKAERVTNQVNVARGIEHLQNAITYAQRGRDVSFDESNPDTFRLIEGELRKAYESLNRLGQSFWTANPNLPVGRIGEVRQLLTHDYTEVNPVDVWDIVKSEAPTLLRRLKRARFPDPDVRATLRRE